MVSEEIDLRRFLAVILRAWYWIAGGALLAGLIGYIWANRLPATYRATALLAAAQLRYNIEFDPKLQTVTDTKAVYRAYPELALSDEVLQQVGARLSRPALLSTLRASLSADPGADLSLVRLSATAASPALAAEIANVWADVVAGHVNALYAGQDGAALSFFEAQLSQQQAELATREQALIDFGATDRGGILTNQLNALMATHAQYLSDRQNVAALLRDVAGVRQQLAALAAGANPSTSQAIAALLLQVRAVSGTTSLPVTLQLSETGETGPGARVQQMALLDSLTATLTERSAELETLLSTLEPQILSLQSQAQAATAAKEQLIQARDVTREAVLTLSRKVEEVRIASQEAGTELQVASRAAPPETPAGPRPLLVAVPVAVLGGAVALVVVSARALRRGELRVAMLAPQRQGKIAA